MAEPADYDSGGGGGGGSRSTGSTGLATHSEELKERETDEGEELIAEPAPSKT